MNEWMNGIRKDRWRKERKKEDGIDGLLDKQNHEEEEFSPYFVDKKAILPYGFQDQTDKTRPTLIVSQEKVIHKQEFSLKDKILQKHTQ